MRLAMLGVSHPRLDGERLATGRGRFVADVRPEGLLEAAVLRSPHAHARVLRVDAARALRLPGVRAVLTAADVPASAVIPNRVPAPEGTAAYLQPAIPRGALRLTEVDVGGGFGVRGELYPEDVLIPLAALALGRPVRWIEDRRENLIAANHAREVEYDVEIGLDPAGRILGMRAVIHADIGAYVRTAALVPAEFGAALLPGPYRVPAYACDLWSVVTNRTPVGTLRSPGRPECNFARERLLDAAAVRLGIDAAEIRKRNLIRADEMPYDIGTVSFGVNTVYDSGDFPGLLDTLLTRLDYAGARAEQQRLAAQGVRRGIGLAVYVEKTGLGPFETAQLEAHANGRITVDTGAASMGPGLETVLAQIVGDALGLPAGRFDVRHADTAAVESGVGTYGSRGTVTAGNAAHMAAAKLLSEARSRAATRLAVP